MHQIGLLICRLSINPVIDDAIRCMVFLKGCTDMWLDAQVEGIRRRMEGDGRIRFALDAAEALDCVAEEMRRMSSGE